MVGTDDGYIVGSKEGTREGKEEEYTVGFDDATVVGK